MPRRARRPADAPRARRSWPARLAAGWSGTCAIRGRHPAWMPSPVWRSSDLEQAVEERAVALERGSQVLRGGLARVPLPFQLALLLVEAVRHPLQDLVHQRVGVRDSVARVVDEALLDDLPAGLQIHRQIGPNQRLPLPVDSG